MDQYNASVQLAFLNGFLHYVDFQRVELGNNSNSHQYCNFVVAFDVGKETFCKILLPKNLEHFDPFELTVGANRDSSIGVFQYDSSASQLSLWVMREYGVKDSWANLLTVTEHLDPVLQVYAFAAFRKNGELILKAAEPGDEGSGTETFLYDPKTQQFRELRSWLDYTCLRFYSYAPTLVLLDMGNDANAVNWCN